MASVGAGKGGAGRDKAAVRCSPGAGSRPPSDPPTHPGRAGFVYANGPGLS